MIENKCFLAFLNAIKSNAPIQKKETEGGYVLQVQYQDEFYREVETNLLNIQGKDAKARYLVDIIEKIKRNLSGFPGPDRHWVIATLSWWLRDKVGLNINPVAYSIAPPVNAELFSKVPQLEASIKEMEAVEEEMEKKEFEGFVRDLVYKVYDSTNKPDVLEFQFQNYNGDKSEFISRLKATINKRIERAELDIKELELAEQMGDLILYISQEEYALDRQRNKEWLQDQYAIREFIFKWIEDKELNKGPNPQLKKKERKPHASTLKRKEEIAGYFYELIKSKIEYSKALEQTAEKYNYSEKQIRRYLDIDK